MGAAENSQSRSAMTGGGRSGVGLTTGSLLYQLANSDPAKNDATTSDSPRVESSAMPRDGLSLVRQIGGFVRRPGAIAGNQVYMYPPPAPAMRIRVDYMLLVPANGGRAFTYWDQGSHHMRFS